MNAQVATDTHVKTPAMEAVEQLMEETRQVYQEAGIVGRVGFGKKPAVIVVDLMKAFTGEDDKQIGSDLTETVEANRVLLRAARQRGIPVIFTVMGYRPDLSNAGVWSEKFFSLKDLTAGTSGVEIDSRLEVQDSDIVIHKDYPSAFFGTSLVSILTAKQIDTVIITGTTTSGCVRASAVDGLSSGYRVIIPRECVADRAWLPHVANLFDIDSKYGDVISLEETLAAIEE